MTALDMDQQALWVEYLTLTGRHGYAEFTGAIHDKWRLSAHEYNKVAAALNEHFIDRGQNHLVPYQELPTE